MCSAGNVLEKIKKRFAQKRNGCTAVLSGWCCCEAKIDGEVSAKIVRKGAGRLQTVVLVAPNHSRKEKRITSIHWPPILSKSAVIGGEQQNLGKSSVELTLCNMWT